MTSKAMNSADGISDGTPVAQSWVYDAVHVFTKKVPVDDGSRQVTMYRLLTGGYLIQTLNRLPAGSTYLEEPRYYKKCTSARTAMKVELGEW